MTSFRIISYVAQTMDKVGRTICINQLLSQETWMVKKEEDVLIILKIIMESKKPTLLLLYNFLYLFSLVSLGSENALLTWFSNTLDAYCSQSRNKKTV
jgi:hypothetical protein